jgi:hypothetical protein
MVQITSRHIDIIPDQTKDYMASVPEDTSPIKEKVALPEDDVKAQDQDVDDVQEYIS